MQQRSEEWFKARKGMITGSQAGAIMGLSPFMTPDDVMRRMVREYHGAESEFQGNVATEYGTHHEPGAMVEYTMETGNVIEDCGFIVHPEYLWLGASPDGLIGEDGVAEIKCPYGQANKNPPKFKTLDEQPHYKIQCLVEMSCTGRAWLDFYQWAQHGTALERIEFADHRYYFETEVTPVLYEFYQQYLVEREHPNAQKYLEPKRKEINSMAAHKLVEEYQELTDAIDRAQERKKDILSTFVKMSGERDADICGHKLTKVVREGSVSYAKALKKYAPDADLEPFRGKPSEFWRLS